MNHEEKLKEIDLCAEIFIRSSNGDQEVYEFDYEDLKAFLILFADGALTQLNEHNKAMDWAAKWIEDFSKGHCEETKQFAANMAESFRANKI